ncbi:MAG: hypothetical protein JWM72_2021 [Actinomycetia bacterium]|nr:hypothetical protein [Actinomycetes bacterium]
MSTRSDFNMLRCRDAKSDSCDILRAGNMRGWAVTDSRCEHLRSEAAMATGLSPINQEIARLARPLVRAARALEVISIFGAIAGVVLGILFATVTATTLSTDILGATSPTTTHPYVAVGIAIALEAIVSGWFFWAVARGLQLMAVDAAARYEVDLNTEVPTEVADRPEFKSDGTL